MTPAIHYGEAKKPPTTCDCPVFGGAKMHFDDCEVMKAAIFKHRQAVEAWIAHHISMAGINRNGKTNIEELQMRCKLKYGKDNTITLEIDGKDIETISNEIPR